MVSPLQEEIFPPFTSCVNVCTSLRKTLIEIEPTLQWVRWVGSSAGVFTGMDLLRQVH